jgi:hypothetical protein
MVVIIGLALAGAALGGGPSPDLDKLAAALRRQASLNAYAAICAAIAALCTIPSKVIRV